MFVFNKDPSQLIPLPLPATSQCCGVGTEELTPYNAIKTQDRLKNRFVL